MNRCLNNIFAYCSGQPEATTRESERNVTPDTSNNRTSKYIATDPACKLDEKKCGKYLAELE